MTKIPKPQFAQVFIHFFTNRSRSTTKLFVSEPTQGLESRMGRIFAILEINTPSRENSKIINQVFGELESTYYSFAEEAYTPHEAFEQTLKRVNENFLEIIKNNTTSLVGNLNEHTMREKINLIVGVVHEKDIVLTALNTIGGFLIHKTNQDYKTINILSPEDTLPSENTQLFNNIVSGNIDNDDYLFFCNKDFLNFISKERFTKTITSLPPHKAADYFKNALIYNEGFNFAAIIISLKTPELTRAGVPQSLSSIDALNTKETNTEKLLSPTLLPNFSDLLSKLQARFAKNAPEKEVPALEDDQLETFPEEIQKTPQTSAQLKKIKQQLRLNLYWNAFTNKLHKALTVIALYIRKIPTVSKILFVIILVTGGLFAYSVMYLDPSHFTFTKKPIINEALITIEQTLDEAEAKLIFGDKEDAKRLLALAENDIASTKIESNEDQEALKQLTEKLNSLVAQVRNITIVKDPLLLHTLEVVGTQTPKITSLSVLGTTLGILDAANSAVYTLDTRSRDIQSILGAIDGTIITSNIVEGKIVFNTTTNALYSIEQSSLRSIPITLRPDEVISDFISYNNALYNIIPSKNQVYRHAVSGTGYGSGVTWIQESGVTLEGAVGIGIDTRIWIAKKSGEILQLFKGIRQAFSIQGLEPALENIDGMIKLTESQYLYILDTSHNRIVVLTDKGEVVTQYFSPSLQNVTAFEVDEPGKALYVANGNEIYAIIMSHL